MGYQVSLSHYGGPLEVLVYLIRRSELDIRLIPIAEIIEQYLKYLENSSNKEVDSIGEFLLLTSLLLEIKSRALLPSERIKLQEIVEGKKDGLLEELLEYRRYKNLSYRLEILAEEEQKKFYSSPLPLPTTNTTSETSFLPKVLKNTTIWDIFQAYQRLEKELGPPPKPIVNDQVPIEHILLHVLNTLSHQSPVPFEKLLNQTERTWLAGLFIAILELARQGQIEIHQEDNFAPIFLEKGERFKQTKDSFWEKISFLKKQKHLK
ncbi:MAG: hypothetical protein D6805_05930 [Planctomycetota bacterium]|nr:MAG: hypothetical protein D6805_05930 [Planctomycetota bacterium]